MQENKQRQAIQLVSYVALLRGLNVGGKGIISMEKLRNEFVKMGFSSVQSYINSGNIVFKTSSTNKRKLEKLIENSVTSALKLTTKVLVRSKLDIENTLAHMPKIFSDPKWKHNIISLGNSINSPMLLQKYKLKAGTEETAYFDGILYWSADLAAGTRAVMYKLSTQPEYQFMTVRSVGTVKKILAMMNKRNI